MGVEVLAGVQRHLFQSRIVAFVQVAQFKRTSFGLSLQVFPRSQLLMQQLRF